MTPYVVNLKTENKHSISELGGKAFNLNKLSEMSNIKTPTGICITTKAFKEIVCLHPEATALINQLSLLKVSDIKNIGAICKDIRSILENTEIPQNIISAIEKELSLFAPYTAFAVRSSATAEDLPTASFAGQQDSFLNIIGLDSILKHVRKCWASLFSERAVLYRIQNNFDHNKVHIAVIVQEMILSEVSGVMFTADPLTSNRNIISIDSSFGLGESLVSGKVLPDNFRASEGIIVSRTITDTKQTQSLVDKNVIELSNIGKKIESFFNYPMDIEWCFKDNSFYIVQARPITTLYPIPKEGEKSNRLYMSAGHMQMMTAAIKPLGEFFLKSVLGNPPSDVIGGRLYVDITNDMASPIGRLLATSIIKMIGDDLITNAIKKVARNKRLLKSLPKGKDKVFNPQKSNGVFAILKNAYKTHKQNDPHLIKELMDIEEKSIKKMEVEIQQLSGDDVFEYIYNDHNNRRQKIATPKNAGALTAVLLTEKWFNKKIEKWLGIKNAADTLLLSIPNSVTSESGLGLLDVADSIRAFPDIIEYLKNPNDETFFEDIVKFEGGESVCASINAYLQNYGMRCSGDIDITAPRWIEKPTEIAPLILSNITNFPPNESKRKWEQGLEESEKRINELVEKVEKCFRGRSKAKKIKRAADLIRNHIGFREYPKFSYMKRYYIYKKAMLKEAENLVNAGVIKNSTDIFYMYFNELRELINGGKFDYSVINKRKNDFEFYNTLIPPRVMTSYGEVITGEYKSDNIPDTALPGIAVSRGTVEGRARIIHSLKEAVFEEGDILVAEFTDPAWTPAFVSIKALVTEVGGLMTHGAVIAREYGLPAVVSVENATRLIKDGDRIRVNGSQGYVEIL